MLIASHFVLNGTAMVDEYQLHPWVHSFSHHRSTQTMLRPISFPDILPSDILKDSLAEFSMTAGDFVEVYSNSAAQGQAKLCSIHSFPIDLE